jgi:hypothetical protein
MESTHTPGPIGISKDGTPDYAPQFTLYGEDGKRTATVFSRADADLYAAAPELLAACKYALEYTIANGDAHNRLRAAIAKATT